MTLILKQMPRKNPLRSLIKSVIWLSIPCALAASFSGSGQSLDGAVKNMTKLLASASPAAPQAPAATRDDKGRYAGGDGDARTRVMRIVMQTQHDHGCTIDAGFRTLTGDCKQRNGWLMSTLIKGDTGSGTAQTQYNLSRKENGVWVTYAIIYPGQIKSDGKTKVDEREANNYPQILGDLIKG